MKKINILIGFEESGVVREAFAKKGHNVYSCDLLPTRKAGQHLQMDIMEALDYLPWDIIIIHPDCTALAVSGNAHYAVGKKLYYRRRQAQEYTANLWLAVMNKAKIGCALENPVGVLGAHPVFHNPQYIQPYEFGHDASKKTCLWLNRLPELTANPKNYIKPRIVKGKPRWSNQTDSGQNKLTPSSTRKRDRAETYQGIADAMATQWSESIEENKDDD